MKKDIKLPDYVPTDAAVLHKPAVPFTFPLTEEDKKALDLLEAKYDAEENCAGLAVPQIGLGKQAIIFAVEADPEIKKRRKDLEQTMPKTMWLNAMYEPIGQVKTEDWEGCFSVPDLVGLVARFKKIRYSACLKDGSKVAGTATGFLARVIQHEVDHTRGILYTEKAIKTMTKEELMALKEHESAKTP